MALISQELLDDSGWAIPIGGYLGHDELFDAIKARIKPEQKGGNGMRAIYITYIVEPKTETVLATVQTIASDRANAERKALMSREVALLELDDIDKVDIFTQSITGFFIRAKPDVQEVKVVEEND